MLNGILFVVTLARPLGPTADWVEPTLDRAVGRAFTELSAVLSASEAVRSSEAAILSETPSVPAEVLASLQARLFQADFAVSVGSAEDSTAVLLSVGIVREGAGGVLRVRCLSPERASVSVRFLGKDWVDHPETGLEGGEGARAFVGHSGIEGGAAEAEAAAMREALAALRRDVGSRVGLDPGAQRAVFERVMPEPIIRGTYLRDSYLETEEKPYGPIYRGHVLLAVPDEEIDAFGCRAREIVIQARWSWVLRVGLMILAAVLLLAGYVSVDGLLRGTCSRLLKVVAAAAFVVTSAALLGIGW